MDLQRDRLRVVLVSPRNPLNIGAAARAMSNFGFLHLRLVNPYNVAYREARSAVGAAPLLARAKEFKTVADAVADCALIVGTTSLGKRELHHPLRRLEYGARLLRSSLAAAPVALLFGSEKFGLSNDDLSHCHWLLRIPTREEHGSMNLGQAVAVCLYEIARNVAIARPQPIKLATAGENERLTTLVLATLAESGYLNPRISASTENKIRRMVLRLNLNTRDADVWMGIYRQILWKLGAGEA
jgi:TrmH family RNA methyltransferase